MIRVLVVEDDITVARVHVGFIASEPGFDVCAVAHTASAALDALVKHEPDLVLLDLHLPDGHGLDLLARMRRVRPTLDAIAITAARERATVSRAIRGGVTSYLLKPFRRDDLVARLARFRPATGAEAKLIDQASVDRLFQPPEQKRNSGLSEATLRAVRDAIAASEADLSAQEAADRVGISRVSARRYLEHLHTLGEVRVRLRYGAGRPERRYGAAPGQS